MSLLCWLNEVKLTDIDTVGGKNASLGEMICNFTKMGIIVPFGFVITTHAYDIFLKENELELKINDLLNSIDNYDDIVNLKRVGIKE
jgi:pyruvate,water dikinase